MRKIIIAFLLSFTSVFSLADTVAIEDFLGEQTYRGAVPCDKIFKNGEEHVQAFEKPQADAKITTPQKIKHSCAAGGGDCLCYVLYVESSPGYLKVFDENKARFLWVAGSEKDSLSIEKMLQPKGDELRFRNPEPKIFLDKDLRKATTLKEASSISEEIEKLILKDYPLPSGVITVPTPRPDNKGVMLVSSLRKGSTAKEFKLTEQIHFFVDSQTSMPRNIVSMARDGNKFLVVTEFAENAENYSSITTGKYAFWAEFKNTSVNYVQRKFTLKESPLYSGIIYELKEIKEVNGKLIAHLELSVQMDRILKNAETPDEEGSQLYKINDIWIPVTDEKGRLNFFIIDNEGC